LKGNGIGLEVVPKSFAFSKLLDDAMTSRPHKSWKLCAREGCRPKVICASNAYSHTIRKPITLLCGSLGCQPSHGGWLKPENKVENKNYRLRPAAPNFEPLAQL
jgi:hypothetical protein